jgi:AcrR family transcriptional regulator
MPRSRPNSPDLEPPDWESSREELLEALVTAFGPNRSPPRQDRSRRRYLQIVSAAAELFADAGYDATTMDAIANAAGTSIGSVYRFFPNKPAIFRAVAGFALAQIQAAVLEVIAGAEQPGARWHALLDEVIDRLAEIHREDPAVRAMLANLQLYDEFAEQDQRLTAELVSATAALLAAWAPALVEPQRQLVATMIVQTIAGILVIAQREPTPLAVGMTAQLKLMLRRYLEPWMAG